jgi:hypothetical protein
MAGPRAHRCIRCVIAAVILMTEEILPIPALPAALKKAAQTGRLIPFIGAGASRLASGPSWKEFADGLLKQLVRLGAINHSQKQQILDQGLTPRMQLSFVRNIAQDKGVTLDFDEIIHAGGDLRHKAGRSLYRALGRLSNTFVTTNYDYWLDWDASDAEPENLAADQVVNSSRRPNVIHRKEDFSFDRLLEGGTVLHLHGSLSDPRNMVITTSDYVELYRSRPDAKTGTEQNNVLNFLRQLFRLRTVLFIGYGLGDLEILEYVIMKGADSRRDTREHFILQPFFSHERETAKLYESYYSKDCNITMLPFLRDVEDHRQLIAVINKMADDMPGKHLMAAERKLMLEGILDGP